MPKIYQDLKYQDLCPKWAWLIVLRTVILLGLSGSTVCIPRELPQILQFWVPVASYPIWQ